MGRHYMAHGVEYANISDYTASAASASILETPPLLSTPVRQPNTLLNRRNNENLLSRTGAPFPIVGDTRVQRPHTSLLQPHRGDLQPS